VAYDVFDSTTRSDVMMICETWRDAESLAAHSASAHFTTLVPKIEALGSLKLEQFEF
jgi:quinol monooxygenase YgiN